MTGRRFAAALRRVSGLVLGLMLVALPRAAPAQYEPVPLPPDPSNFVSRDGSHLTLLGDPFRFGGFELPWLGRLGRPDRLRVPEDAEVADGLESVDQMGGRVLRAATLADSAGCALCIEPEEGRFDEAALRHLDRVLKEARDQGLKLILPLAGDPARCAGDPGETACAFPRWKGKPPAAFFTDPAVFESFRHYVETVLNRVNTLTRVPYRDDPAILAWENCEACGGADPAAVAAWTARLARVVHAADPRHLFENGAFAGRLHGPGAVDPALLGLPGVDLIGETVSAATPAAGRADALLRTAETVALAGRVLVVDAYDWAPAAWPQPGSYGAFLDAIVGSPAIGGALLSELRGHAAAGGLMPLPAGAPAGGSPGAGFYFPGFSLGGITAAEMQGRARRTRVFDWAIRGVTPPPAYQRPPPPVPLDAHGFRLRWRGSPGALYYSIQRSADPLTEAGWTEICRRCVNDLTPAWTDPAPPAAGPVWYRLLPYDMNGHAGMPSAPIQAR